MMNDLTTALPELPEIPTDPHPTSVEDALVITELPAAPESDPETPEAVEEDEGTAEEPEAVAAAPVAGNKRIGKTVAHQMDDRVRVMEDRLDSFEKLLHELGVVDEDAIRMGVRGKYVEALEVVHSVRPMLARLRGLTNEVKVTFDSL